MCTGHRSISRAESRTGSRKINSLRITLFASGIVELQAQDSVICIIYHSSAYRGHYSRYSDYRTSDCYA